MNHEVFCKFREAALARAFQRVAGEDYNAARRQLLERNGSASVIYELTFPERADWQQWRDQTFPLLAKYLKAQGIEPEQPKAVIIAAFYGGGCYFIEAEKFMAIFKEVEGLNSAALHFRMLQWLAN